jgi:Bacterial SH3 domain
MRWSSSGLVKLVLGVILAIALLVSGSVALALIFINRSSTLPPKPIFANDSSAVKKAANKADPTKKPATAAKKPTPASSSKPSPSPLASGTYSAKVTWAQGLSMRAEPSLEAERVGSLDYNQEVVVLEQSQDEKWQHVRLADSDLEGWVKAGNTEKTAD